MRLSRKSFARNHNVRPEVNDPADHVSFASANAKAVISKAMSIRNRHRQSRATNDWLFVIAMAVNAKKR